MNESGESKTTESFDGETENPPVQPRSLLIFLRSLTGRLYSLGETANDEPAIGRQHAAVDGMRTAVLRVLFPLVLIAGSFWYYTKSEKICALMPRIDLLRQRSLPGFVRFGICPLAWLLGAAAVVIATAADTERKWLQVNWATFILLASATLSADGSWCCPVAIAAALFGLHFSFHLWLKSLDRRRQWELEVMEQQREPLETDHPPTPRPKLIDRYGGVAGFDNERGS